MEKICNSAINCTEEKVIYLKKNGYDILECRKCSHRFLDIPNFENHLTKVYSDDYFFGGRATGYPNYLEQKDIIINYGIKYAKIIRKHAKPGKVLDTGSAAGFILKGFEKAGWDCHGVEPNDTMAKYGREELNLPITTGSFENFESSKKFDLINLVQVIGHFYDIDKAMHNINNLLKPNGLVLVESWNRESAFAKLLGKNWPEYSPPSVVHWFSENTLIQLFRSYGFKLVDQGLPSKRINIKHALSILGEKIPDFIMKKKLMNMLNKIAGKYSIIYPPMDLKWYIFKNISGCLIALTAL